MPSPRQLAANRRNGARGGPKTDAGKQRSRLNSIKHGLTSCALVILQPRDGAEDALVLAPVVGPWARAPFAYRRDTHINISAASAPPPSESVSGQCQTSAYLPMWNSIVSGSAVLRALSHQGISNMAVLNAGERWLQQPNRLARESPHLS